MKKNISSQLVGCQLISSTDGSAITSGTTTVYLTKDGTYGIGTVGSGAATHKGNGYWEYAPSQAETNYDHIAFTFTNASAVTASVQVYTNFPQVQDVASLVNTLIGAPSGASVSADIATRMPTSHINATAGKVNGVALVDVTTTNTDMRGTNGANTVVPDNTGVAAIKVQTDQLTFTTGLVNANATATVDNAAIASAVRTELAPELLKITDHIV